MLEKIAKKMTPYAMNLITLEEFKSFIKVVRPNKDSNSITKEQQIEFFEMSIKRLLSDITFVLLLLLISSLTNSIKTTIISAISLCTLRAIASGIHMDTELKCWIVSLTVLIISGLTATLYFSVNLAFGIVAATVLYACYSLTQYAQKEKRLLLILYACVWIAFIIIQFRKSNTNFIMASCLGVLWECFSVTLLGYKVFNKIRNLKI